VIVAVIGYEASDIVEPADQVFQETFDVMLAALNVLTALGYQCCAR